MDAGVLEISTDRARLDVDAIHRFLADQSYWARGRSREAVELSVRNSVCFGAFLAGAQIGFVRLVTDQVVVGYVADMFVLPEHRGNGVGKALAKAVVDHADRLGLQVLLLRSKDARSLYAKVGFESAPRPDEVMARYRPAVQLAP